VRIDRLKKEYEIETRWVFFPLRPDAPEDGITLEEIYAGRGVDIHQVRQRLNQVAQDLGLPFSERKMTYNSRLAQELAKWAESKGAGEEFHRAVFRAYYVDTKNIGKVDELLRLAESVGLPQEEAKGVLEQRPYREAVDADWTRCYDLGITAVPTFVIDRECVVGLQPYEVFEQFLKTKNIKKRS
jgi:predicted DsbA family dithiol-disulfide isomerase